MSKQLSCLATFGGVSGWTVQEAVDQLGESQVLRSNERTYTCDQLVILFQRPLFTKTDDRFSFCHQLFCEYLAAAALRSLPLRKQRQLLETPSPVLRHRVLTPYRGVAVFLAEMSPEFRDHLIEHDPLVAFLAELPGLPPTIDERLTKAVIDQAIANRRAYWWEIPPRGERPLDFLAKHRPRDVAGFLRSYLECGGEMPLLWSTACAAAWGGCLDLNDLLLDLAHNNGLHVSIRKSAIDAVIASGATDSIRALYDLLDSKNDQVRGHVLRGYRIAESPRPSDYLSKLHGGAHDDSLHCLLQTEAISFAAHLDEQGLGEAVRAVWDHFAELGNLRPHALRGLFRRAIDLGFDEIPPALVIELWLRHNSGQVFYMEQLQDLVSSSAGLFARIWNYVMDRLAGEDCEFYYFELDGHLAQVCNDRVFDLLPANKTALKDDQEQLILGVLSRHWQKEPTSERLHDFQIKAPAFTARFQLPKPSVEPVPRDPLESIRRISSSLGHEDLPCDVKVNQILLAIAQTIHGDDQSWPEPAEIVEFLRHLSAPLVAQVLGVFQVCVSKTNYAREQTAADKFRRTPREYAIPFWVLRSFQREIPKEKLDEFIRCYAFSSVPGPEGSKSYYSLLDELRDLDSSRWADTVVWLVEFPGTNSYDPLNYLISQQSDVYVPRCRQRLTKCDFSTTEFGSLLDYWVVRKPTGFTQTLQDCYGYATRDEHKTQVLFALLAEDDDWAWNELRHRIENVDAPTEAEHLSSHRPLRLPQNRSRLTLLADWYAYVRGGERRAHWPESLGPALLETIVAIGGSNAIEELRRLQEQRAFPDARWLSHAILRVEDLMLTAQADTMDAGPLLDFINREEMGVVLNERDLFEWVCRAVEWEKEDLEKRAQQVAGYWNEHDDEWSPKTEPQCQNLLWPAVQRRLAHIGVVGTEERFIRADRADFWVEKPIKEERSLQVGVELKVARKGYGYKRLVVPVQTQLWQQYLEPSQCKHGIYVVLWFRDSERYPYPTKWATPQELLEELDRRKQDIMDRHDVEIACYVIDLTTWPRLH